MINLNEIIAKINTSKVKKYFFIAIVAIMIVVGLKYLSDWHTRAKVEEFTRGLVAEFNQKNKQLSDNIVKVQQEQQQLKTNFNNQSFQLEVLKKQRRKEWIDAKNTKDPKIISQYFDNTIDRYVPQQ